jgi:hypothetical protein
MQGKKERWKGRVMQGKGKGKGEEKVQKQVKK